MPSLEDFWAGRPLNEALAKMKAGIEEPEIATEERPEFADSSDINRSLTRAEQVELRNFLRSACWQVVSRLVRRSLHRREQNAIKLSQDNPLGNSDGVAREWAYVAIWKMMYTELEAEIATEVQLLNYTEQNKRKTENTGE